jgi:drug/metabolite transporter (DMT)-like permease
MLQEYINPWGIIGMFLTIISLLLLLHNQAEKEEVKQENFGEFRRGALMGLLGAALTALAFIFSKKTFVETGHHISEFHGTWIRIIVAFGAMWLIDVVRNKNQNFIGEIIKSRQKSVLLFSAILFGSILGLSFSLMAITRMEVAVAYTIFSMVPLAVILVSVIVFRKKLPLINWLWSLLAIAGAIILVWSKRSG